jgi:ATP-binding cassette subfamily B protein
MKPFVVLLRLVAFSPRYFAACVLFAIVIFFVLPIPVGLATRVFFDALSGNATAGLNAWSAIALLIAAQIGGAIIGPLLGNPWNSLQQKSHVLLQRNLFAGILRGYGRHGLQQSRGETISRFRDDPLIMGDGLDALCDLIGRSFFAVGAAFVMWTISPTLTLVLLAPLLVSTYLMEVLGTRTMVYHASSRAATSQLTGYLGELMSAQLAIKVAGAASHAVRRLNELGDDRRHRAVRDRVFGVLLDSLSVNSAHFATGVVLLLGAEAIRDGSFTVGDFALFVVYLDQLVWYPAEIARLISDLKRIDVSYRRMHALVPGEPAVALVTAAPVYLDGRVPELSASPQRQRFERLKVKGLSYVHPNGDLGIIDVSFELERGSFTVVTGRIGVGKTTLLHVLLGLLPRAAGEIRWNGRIVQDPSTFFVPPQIAYTPQVPRLFSESLRENLLLGWPAESAALERAVHAAVLERDVATLGRGLDTLVGPRGVKLSGGQVQRAAASRMFVRDAELLVFDDLSSALDVETEAELWRRLFAREREVTCLVVSHRPTALRWADQVLVMDAGRLHVARDQVGDVFREHDRGQVGVG